MTRSLRDFKVLTFDCYGTLIDWETGIWDALQPMIAAAGLDALTRQDALAAYGRHEHDMEKAHPRAPYNEILTGVHAAMAAEYGAAPNADLDAAFGESVPFWPAFADSAVALRELKKTYRLVVLSNVHRRGFDASARKLGVTFDAVYTAEDIGSYKPADANFSYLLHHLERDFGLVREDVLHTAQSLFHDHVPANRFGLANAWIDRQNRRGRGASGIADLPVDMPTMLYEFDSLGAMAEAVANA